MSETNFITPFHSCGVCNKDGFIITKDYSKKCSCRIEYENNLNIIKGLLSSNVITYNSSKESLDFLLNLSFNDYKGNDYAGNLIKIKKFCTNFKNKYNNLNLFFSGDPGTQKTTLAKIMIKELIKQKVSCYYIIANDLIDIIIESGRDIEKKNLIESILNYDFLVIDEFDEHKIVTFSSGWQRKNLFPFLKKRLESIRKSTLFISNQKIDNLGAYFEGAIQDLILREVPDQTMIFKDNYIKNRGNINLSQIWDD